MWPGWADSKWSQIPCLGGAEKPQARASPGQMQPHRAPALEHAPHWPACPSGGGVEGSPAHRSAGVLGHQALLPPGAASSAQPRTWSCSASRLRICAPTTCSVLLARKLGGREEREELEEETGSLHTPPRPPLRAARARDRRHCSSCRLYSFCLRLPPEETHRPDPRPLPCAPVSGPGRSVHRATLIALLILSFCKKRNY